MTRSQSGKNCAIAVMAKAPRPGQVKTRLVPPLTHEAAGALSACFLRDITENIALAALRQPIQGYIAYAPAGLESLFDGMLATGTKLVLADGSGEMPPRVEGFGRCLLHAARTLFAEGYESVCLLNSDSPTLPTALLAEAAERLDCPGDRMVLGAADDGGYYLIGMKAPHAALFENIAWSTDTVADQTRARAREAGLEIAELPSWYDVDDRAALVRLLGEFAADPANGPLAPYPAPATAAGAERLRLSELLTNRQSGLTAAATGRNDECP
jgi:rSAM/selenodomain-associated transferase 1